MAGEGYIPKHYFNKSSICIFWIWVGINVGKSVHVIRYGGLTTTSRRKTPKKRAADTSVSHKISIIREASTTRSRATPTRFKGSLTHTRAIPGIWLKPPEIKPAARSSRRNGRVYQHHHPTPNTTRGPRDKDNAWASKWATPSPSHPPLTGFSIVGVGCCCCVHFSPPCGLLGGWGGGASPSRWRRRGTATCKGWLREEDGEVIYQQPRRDQGTQRYALGNDFALVYTRVCVI